MATDMYEWWCAGHSIDYAVLLRSAPRREDLSLTDSPSNRRTASTARVEERESMYYLLPSLNIHHNYHCRLPDMIVSFPPTHGSVQSESGSVRRSRVMSHDSSSVMTRHRAGGILDILDTSSPVDSSVHTSDGHTARVQERAGTSYVADICPSPCFSRRHRHHVHV
jgi:hypothetical protein